MSEEKIEAEATPKPKKKKKGLVIIGAVVAVIAVAAVGMLIWHEQPSFCNAICHTPMDPYLPTLEAEPGQPAIDKWGNEVSDASGMMAALHHAKAGSACLDCHEPTLSEQIGEGIEWITGNYDVVENPTYGVVVHEADLAQLTAASGKAAEEFCLTAGCHDLTKAELAVATKDYARNPHTAPHGDVACSDCHKAHRASVNYCASCHSDAPVPAGWLTPIQAKKLPAQA